MRWSVFLNQVQHRGGVLDVVQNKGGEGVPNGRFAFLSQFSAVRVARRADAAWEQRAVSESKSSRP